MMSIKESPHVPSLLLLALLSPTITAHRSVPTIERIGQDVATSPFADIQSGTLRQIRKLISDAVATSFSSHQPLLARSLSHGSLINAWGDPESRPSPNHFDIADAVASYATSAIEAVDEIRALVVIEDDDLGPYWASSCSNFNLRDEDVSPTVSPSFSRLQKCAELAVSRYATAVATEDFRAAAEVVNLAQPFLPYAHKLVAAVAAAHARVHLHATSAYMSSTDMLGPSANMSQFFALIRPTLPDEAARAEHVVANAMANRPSCRPAMTVDLPDMTYDEFIEHVSTTTASDVASWQTRAAQSAIGVEHLTELSMVLATAGLVTYSTAAALLAHFLEHGVESCDRLLYSHYVSRQLLTGRAARIAPLAILSAVLSAQELAGLYLAHAEAYSLLATDVANVVARRAAGMLSESECSRLESTDVAPQSLVSVDPVYPEIAKQARVTGPVILRVAITADGRPGTISGGEKYSAT